jgi:hypothetical protein
LKKEFKTEDESKVALASTMLVNLQPTQRFNSSQSPTELMFRWEDAQIGALVRLKAEKSDVKFAVPIEYRNLVPKIEKQSVAVIADIDYYTVAPVEREQWNAVEWLPQKLRIIRKEVHGILQGGGK